MVPETERMAEIQASIAIPLQPSRPAGARPATPTARPGAPAAPPAAAPAGPARVPNQPAPQREASLVPR
jgi:cell division protein FtsI (penicillin-binding protein 3)